VSATHLERLRQAATTLRWKLDRAFRPDTAAAGSHGPTASAGHCAAVAYIVREMFRGAYVSASVDGQSHWFNRIETGDGVFDVDLTGDQFGRNAVQVAPSGTLYDGTRERAPSELRSETIARGELLAQRAGLVRITEDSL
jgi:hypothetical protein